MVEKRVFTSRVHRIWLFTIGVYAIGLLVLVGYVGAKWLAGLRDIDQADILATFLIPSLGSALWLLVVWLNRRGMMREIAYDQDGVRLIQLAGYVESFAWENVTTIEYHSDDDCEIIFKIGHKSLQVCSHGFSGSDWECFYRDVFALLGPEVRYRNLSVEFHSKQAKWITRASIATLIIGFVIAVGLFMWDIQNGAGWIVLIGTIALITVLGIATPDVGAYRIPASITMGFFARKLVACIPISLIIFTFYPPADFNPPQIKVTWVYYASNACFFGGMAVGLIVYGGFSPRAYLRGPYEGFLRYHKVVVAAALAVLVVGFIFKCANETWESPAEDKPVTGNSEVFTSPPTHPN